MAYFEVAVGPERGREYPIEGTATMGRSPENTIFIPDGRCSRYHARVTSDGTTHTVTDLGSSNGTQVNGSPLQKGAPLPLGDGDYITIGSTRLVFHVGVSRRSVAAGVAESVPPPPSPSLPAAVPPPAPPPAFAPLDFDGAMSSPEVSLKMDANLSMVDASFSMVEACERARGPDQGLLEAIARLQAMVMVSSDLGAVTDKEAVLERIMKSMFSIFPQADRAFVMLRNRATGEMVPAVGRDRYGKYYKPEEFAISRTIVSTVIDQRQSVLSSDAQEDDRFDAGMSIVQQSIRSVAYVPFIWQDEILGLISVDTTSKTGSFDSEDLMMLTGIAAQAAIAIKSAELYDDVQVEAGKRAMLSRYISPDVVEGVLDGNIPLELRGELKHGTVFFCDIVGFTAMAEKSSAVEIIDRLNAYFHITTEVVTRNKGTLHKFGGDMIMAFWNVLLKDDKAEFNAVRTGLEMQIAVWSFDLDLAMTGQTPVYLGIGVNTGEFAGGNVGGEMIEYTIIGDNVNLGQRIESLAGRWQVFVAEETYESVADVCSAIALPRVRVKGKAEEIQVYSIRGLEVGPGEMLLDVPMNLADGEHGGPVGPGIITGAGGDGEGMQLSFSTRTPVVLGQILSARLEVPELARELVLKGEVVHVSTAQHDGKTEYTKAVLAKLSGDSEALSLCRKGTLVRTRKKWTDMVRR